MANMLEVEEISKQYDGYYAVSPVSFALHQAEIAVITGPNGSGKTTLFSCLTGLIPASSGTVKVAGFDLFEDELEVHRRMASVPDVPRFYTELTAWEHLEFIASANDVEKSEIESRGTKLFTDFGLYEARSLFPHNYSRGMRLKLGLAMAFIRPFDVLLLDEPTSALDFESVDLLINLLRGYREAGKAILLSTHDQRLIESLADRQLMINNGVIKDN
ncbi:MAG: ABC transporter ATP-binding protein [Chloroflexi bacterium HGW-Chloroflexi-5]|nr:MAG: ABC transporter ATP-binding protein [Chloroflexi bacterium HGW-Chloroflexi-5]